MERDRVKEQKRVEVLIEALPYIKRFYGKTFVVKYGGNAMIEEKLRDIFITDVVLLRYVGVNLIIVHGGGPQITEFMEKLSLPVEFVDGQRITDEDTMKIVKMVLIGKINKEIVSGMNTHGMIAVGLSGEDGLLMTAVKREHLRNGESVDLGFVGDVGMINTKILENLIEDEFIPVIASTGIDADGRSFNINADQVASSIASAIKADKLIYLTNVDGIFRDKNDPSTLIEEISVTELEDLRKLEIISEGMTPKVDGCETALLNGVNLTHIINGTVEHALLLEIFKKKGIGTMIKTG